MSTRTTTITIKTTNWGGHPICRQTAILLETALHPKFFPATQGWQVFYFLAASWHGLPFFARNRRGHLGRISCEAQVAV